MPPSALGFEDTMRSLSSLVAARAERRAASLAHLAAIRAALDEPLFSPSPELLELGRSRSQPTPTQAMAPDELRAQLPERRTKGGPYGDAILARVAASYGL